MSLVPNVANNNSQGALVNPSFGFFYNQFVSVLAGTGTFLIPITNAPIANQMTPFVPSPSSVTLNRSGVYRINITISMAPNGFTNANYQYQIYPIKNGVPILPTNRTTSVSRSGAFAFSTADSVLSSAEWLEQCIAGDTIEAVLTLIPTAFNFDISSFSMTIQQIE